MYNIIQNQFKEGIVEKVDEICKQDTAEGENVLICHINLSLENQPKQLN